MKKYTKKTINGTSLTANHYFKAFGRFYRITDVTFETGRRDGLVQVRALEVLEDGKLHPGNSIDINVGKYGLITVYTK